MQLMCGDFVEVEGQRFHVRRASVGRLRILTFAMEGRQFAAFEQNRGPFQTELREARRELSLAQRDELVDAFLLAYPRLCHEAAARLRTLPGDG